jgi:hypothetical protein
MHKWSWIACTLGAAMFVGGCAHDEKTQEAQLGHIPISEKEPIFTAQHNVEVEDANLNAAKRATEEAKIFRDVSNKELDSSKARVAASEKAIKLEGKSGNAKQLNDAQTFFDLASKEQIASQAKVDYANKLVDLRENEETLITARRDEAKTRVKLLEAQAVAKNGMKPVDDPAKLEREDVDARTKVMERERRVAVMRDDAQRYRSTWDDRRQSFNLAQRGAPVLTPTPTPPKGQVIQQAPMPVEPKE